MTAQWDQAKKACSLSTNNHALALDQISLHDQNIEAVIHGKLPLELASDIGNLFAYQMPAIQGAADFNMQLVFDAAIPRAKGEIKIKEMHIGSHAVADEIVCNLP